MVYYYISNTIASYTIVLVMIPKSYSFGIFISIYLFIYLSIFVYSVLSPYHPSSLISIYLYIFVSVYLSPLLGVCKCAARYTGRDCETPINNQLEECHAVSMNITMPVKEAKEVLAPSVVRSILVELLHVDRSNIRMEGPRGVSGM